MRPSEAILSDARHNKGIESNEIEEVVYNAVEDQIPLSQSGEEVPLIESIPTIEIETPMEPTGSVKKLTQLWTSLKQKVGINRKEPKRDKFIASFFE